MGDRPVLLELVDRAGAGEYDLLVVAKLDRLSRDYPTLAVLERRLQKRGVDVVSAAEENGDGPVAESSVASWRSSLSSSGR